MIQRKERQLGNTLITLGYLRGDCEGLGETDCKAFSNSERHSQGVEELFRKADSKSRAVCKSLAVPALGVRSGQWVQVPCSRAWSQSRC